MTAVKYVRDNAAEWDVDADKIIIAGFSAGGHVAGLLGTGWNSKRLDISCYCGTALLLYPQLLIW